MLTAPNSFLFGVFYRSPGFPVDILENLNCSLASIQGSSTPLVLCGDWYLTGSVVPSAITENFSVQLSGINFRPASQLSH